MQAVHTLIPVDVEKPRSMFLDPPLSDAEFEALCQANDFIQFERTREGEILMRSPTGGFTGGANAGLIAQLNAWWTTHRSGRIFDSNGGFFLPDGSMLSPDAAYVTAKKFVGLTEDQPTGFPCLCPDFVIELLSNSDSLPKAKQKMQRWIENGASLGWLIDPAQKHVYVYQSGCTVLLESGSKIEGIGPVDGFTLNLDELWRRYEL